MREGLVSIISPCYNKARVLKRFLDSIIAQDYRPIELIMINDGSTDDGGDVLTAYAATMKENDIEYIVLTQKNAGLGSAIQTGLNSASGEFICWPDCDDWYEPTAISARVNYLCAHQEYASVTCNAYIYNEGDLNTPIGKIAGDNQNDNNPEQFQLMLEGKSIFCAGCHLVRTSCLFDVLTNRQIYPSRHGQNFQLLLPLYYKYKRGFLNNPLYNYVVYDDSMSHSPNTFDDTIRMRDGRYEIKVNTILRIKDMREDERKTYLQRLAINELRYRIAVAYEYDKLEYARIQLAKLRKKGVLQLRDIAKYCIRKILRAAQNTGGYNTRVGLIISGLQCVKQESLNSICGGTAYA